MIRKLLSLGLMLCLFPVKSHGVIAYVQSTGGNTTATSVDVSFVDTVTSGNLIVVAARIGTDQTCTVSDSAGNTYTQQIDQKFTPVTDDHLYIFYAANVTGGSLTITIDPSGTPSIRWTIHEYSGIATSSPVDQSTSLRDDLGLGTAVDSGNITTTQADELLFGAASVSGSKDFTPGADYTERQEIVQKISTEDRIVSSTLTDSADWTISANDTYGAAIVSFKGATSRRVMVVD